MYNPNFEQNHPKFAYLNTLKSRITERRTHFKL